MYSKIRARAMRGLLALLYSLATEAVDMLAVYYGQGENQQRLRSFCESQSIEYIIIGFVTQFQNTGLAPPYQATNYVYNCPYLPRDIEYCQNLGKRILISIGGGVNVENSYYLSNEEEARKAVDDIWRAFGPPDKTWGHPRPFGNAVVNGFDLDLETGASLGQDGAVYAYFAQKLRDKFANSTETFLLTAAPQCIYPDASLSQTLTNVALDFIFVQFYNNPGCHPSNFLRGNANAQRDNFERWNSIAAKNKHGNCKWFLGLLSSPSSNEYVSQVDVGAILGYIQPKSHFGGIMLWEATSASRDIGDNGLDYIDNCKRNLREGIQRVTGTILGFVSTTRPTESTPKTTTTTKTTKITITKTSTIIVTSTKINGKFQCISSSVVTAALPPGQTHLYVASNCNKWYYLNAEDSCTDITSKLDGSVSVEQLEEWNEAAREGCLNAWPDTWFCVGVSQVSSNTLPSIVSSTPPFGTVFLRPPSATQTNVASNCNLWHLVQNGENCKSLAAGAGGGVTTQDVIEWNPAVGVNCGNLWLGYYACIGSN
ncbi:hypothetical protein TWF481_002974 [Arthrobotrys musiformis]|uniref:chitinase n=1 Tax=Arthrobotrys musiformis TaxID=47236 RepID=A0AAV9VTZ8_9PEZI